MNTLAIALTWAADAAYQFANALDALSRVALEHTADPP